jgi:hypothetical protein
VNILCQSITIFLSGLNFLAAYPWKKLGCTKRDEDDDGGEGQEGKVVIIVDVK